MVAKRWIAVSVKSFRDPNNAATWTLIKDVEGIACSSAKAVDNRAVEPGWTKTWL